MSSKLKIYILTPSCHNCLSLSQRYKGQKEQEGDDPMGGLLSKHQDVSLNHSITSGA